MNHKMWWIKLLLAIMLAISIIYQTDFQEGHASLIRMSIEDLVNQADCILLGKVIDIENRWNSEGRTIYTYVKVAVEKMIKGDKKPDEIFVEVPGGMVEDVAVKVPEAPQFKVGERVILFLNKDASGEYQVLGGIQGKYTVTEDKVFERDISLNDFMAELHEKLENRRRVTRE